MAGLREELHRKSPQGPPQKKEKRKLLLTPVSPRKKNKKSLTAYLRVTGLWMRGGGRSQDLIRLTPRRRVTPTPSFLGLGNAGAEGGFHKVSVLISK